MRNDYRKKMYAMQYERIGKLTVTVPTLYR